MSIADWRPKGAQLGVPLTPGVATLLQGIFVFRPLAETLFERFSHGKRLPNGIFLGL
jgi:hypothetical protein